MCWDAKERWILMGTRRIRPVEWVGANNQSSNKVRWIFGSSIGQFLVVESGGNEACDCCCEDTRACCSLGGFFLIFFFKDLNKVVIFLHESPIIDNNTN